MRSSPRGPRGQGPWLILAAAALWGTTGTARALGPAGADPLSVGAVRIMIGGALFALLALMTHRADVRRLAPIPTIIAAASVAIYQLAFCSSVAILGVALGTIIAIGSAAAILAGVAVIATGGSRPSSSTSPAVAG